MRASSSAFITLLFVSIGEHVLSSQDPEADGALQPAQGSSVAPHATILEDDLVHGSVTVMSEGYADADMFLRDEPFSKQIIGAAISEAIGLNVSQSLVVTELTMVMAVSDNSQMRGFIASYVVSGVSLQELTNKVFRDMPEYLIQEHLVNAGLAMTVKSVSHEQPYEELMTATTTLRPLFSAATDDNSTFAKMEPWRSGSSSPGWDSKTVLGVGFALLGGFTCVCSLIVLKLGKRRSNRMMHSRGYNVNSGELDEDMAPISINGDHVSGDELVLMRSPMRFPRRGVGRSKHVAKDPPPPLKNPLKAGRRNRFYGMQFLAVRALTKPSPREKVEQSAPRKKPPPSIQDIEDEITPPSRDPKAMMEQWKHSLKTIASRMKRSGRHQGRKRPNSNHANPDETAEDNSSSSSDWTASSLQSRNSDWSLDFPEPQLDTPLGRLKEMDLDSTADFERIPASPSKSHPDDEEQMIALKSISLNFADIHEPLFDAKLAFKSTSSQSREGSHDHDASTSTPRQDHDASTSITMSPDLASASSDAVKMVNLSSTHEPGDSSLLSGKDAIVDPDCTVSAVDPIWVPWIPFDPDEEDSANLEHSVKMNDESNHCKMSDLQSGILPKFVFPLKTNLLELCPKLVCKSADCRLEPSVDVINPKSDIWINLGFSTHACHVLEVAANSEYNLERTCQGPQKGENLKSPRPNFETRTLRSKDERQSSTRSRSWPSFPGSRNFTTGCAYGPFFSLQAGGEVLDLDVALDLALEMGLGNGEDDFALCNPVPDGDREFEAKRNESSGAADSNARDHKDFAQSQSGQGASSSSCAAEQWRQQECESSSRSSPHPTALAKTSASSSVSPTLISEQPVQPNSDLWLAMDFSSKAAELLKVANPAIGTGPAFARTAQSAPTSPHVRRKAAQTGEVNQKRERPHKEKASIETDHIDRPIKLVEQNMTELQNKEVGAKLLITNARTELLYHNLSPMPGETWIFNKKARDMPDDIDVYEDQKCIKKIHDLCCRGGKYYRRVIIKEVYGNPATRARIQGTENLHWMSGWIEIRNDNGQLILDKIL